MDEGSFGRNYRRGLVLGLTLAEIFILLLFLLLLVFSYLLSLEDQKWDDVRQILDQQALPYASPEELENSVLVMANSYEDYDDLKEQFEDPETAAETIRALNEIKALLKTEGIAIDDPNELSTKLKSMTESEQLAEKYKNVCGDLETVENLLSALHGEEKTALDVLDNCPATLSNTVNPNANEVMPETLSEAEAMINRLRRTNASLSQKMVEITGGRGLVYPPCWSRLENANRPVYTYNLTISDEGITVQLGDDRTGQDLSPIKANGEEPLFGRAITRNEFSRKTKGLFDWSVANECRFFVRVSDNTSETNKAGYKSFLATIENHFYKYLVER